MCTCPAIVGLNVTKDVTLVATPGVSYLERLAVSTSDPHATEHNHWSEIATHGWLARLGAGINVRASSRFALQPELVVFRSLQPSHEAPLTSVNWIGFGLGFSWNEQPSFADFDGCPPPAAGNQGVSAKQ